jgi:hypothetical protein
MSFTETDIRSAGRAIALGDEQVEGLLTVLRAHPPSIVAAPATPRVYERVRFDLVHLLWYAGALIIMGAMGLFSTLAFEQMGGPALTVTALVYAALFAAGGHYLWHHRSLPTPGGLMITVAIGMIPLAVFGIQDTFGWWGDAGRPGNYQGFYVWVKSGWLPMEIATILACLVALRFYPFPFIVAVMAFALWFMSMDLVPWIMHGRDTSWAENWTTRRVVSMVFGLVMMGLAWFVDLRHHRREDFGFWLHLFGLMAFWGGLTFAESSGEFAKAVYCLINVGLILLSVFLMRRIYAVFGAIGVSIYLGHLASRVFEDSLLFPFALSLIGLGIIGAGLALHRNRPKLSAWLADSLPAPLKRLRPPLAGGAARLEHA